MRHIFGGDGFRGKALKTGAVPMRGAQPSFGQSAPQPAAAPQKPALPGRAAIPVIEKGKGGPPCPVCRG
jgi:hypothetical protein